MSEDRMRTRWNNLFPEEAYEHARAARAEMRKSFEAFLPPEVVTHHRAARKEMLLAMRSVLDKALQRIEESDKQ